MPIIINTMGWGNNITVAVENNNNAAMQIIF